MKILIALISAIIYVSYLFFNINYLNINILSLSWQLLVLYVFFSVLFLYKYRSGSIFCPELFFFIIFFFETFTYAPILYNQETELFAINVLRPNINDVSVMKGQCITILSFLFYILGASIISNKTNLKSYKIDKVANYNIIHYKIPIHLLTTMLIILSMALGGYKLIDKYTDSSIGLTDAGSMFPFIVIFIVISTIVELLSISKRGVVSFSDFLKKISKLYCINIVFLSVFFLLSGARSFIFPLLLPLLFLYDRFIIKVKKRYIIFLVLVSFILMTAIKETRTETDDSTKISINLVSISQDFISGNIGLFYLVEYADINGDQGGQNAILQMVSFIPFAQSFFVNVLGVTSTSSSSDLYTNYANINSGQGTHVIGDLYYTFGWFGAVFCMFILGLFTSLFYKKVNNRYPQIWILTVYLLLLGNSIVFSRVEFFYLVRNIGFSLIILWGLKLIFPVKKHL